MVSSLLHGAYLGMRDLVSSAEVKAENKQYAQLEKTIAALKILEKQQSKLVKKITSKLHQLGGGSSTQTTDEKEITESLSEGAENKKDEYVYKLFQEPAASANQLIVDTHYIQNTQRNLV